MFKCVNVYRATCAGGRIGRSGVLSAAMLLVFGSWLLSFGGAFQGCNPCPVLFFLSTFGYAASIYSNAMPDAATTPS